MKRFSNSGDCLEVCDMLEDLQKKRQSTNKINLELVKKIADKIIPIQKEQNRINAHYFSKPNVDIENDVDNMFDIYDFIINDTHNFFVYIENLARDFFDYEREIADEDFRISIRGADFTFIPE